jgi:hemerythrin superfamily protein
MPRTSRAAQSAREQVIADLKNDHKRVKKAYKDFEKLGSDDPEACRAIVEQVLLELQVHASLEEELLYPAARDALPQADLIDEAEVEHESAHQLMDQLRSLGPEDDKYAARFTVLCEYVLHHVKEEEGELFPALEELRLDWENLAETMSARRQELTASQDEDAAVATGNGQSAGSTLATNGVSDEGLASSRKI